MMHTKFSNYTEAELLSLVDEKRSQSALIDELCTRLEKLNGTHVSADADHCVECPVCEAALSVDYDESNNLFEVEVRND
jgi:NAD-dependent dihydropyrimidine dehydrogenase PreA subunit